MQNYSDGPAAIETTTVASALQMRPLHAENLIGRVHAIIYGTSVVFQRRRFDDFATPSERFWK